MTIPTLGWGTSSWDGEQFEGLKRGKRTIRILPLDAFRAEFMGRQWGVPAEFLCYGQPFSYEEAWAFTLLHDVPARPGKPDAQLELCSALWKVMDDFGRKEAEWLPYWRNSNYVHVSPQNAYVSLYRHPRNGVLAAVSNLGQHESLITFRLNVSRLGLPVKHAVVQDALRQSVVGMTNGEIRLRLPSFGWKLIWIRSAQGMK